MGATHPVPRASVDSRPGRIGATLVVAAACLLPGLVRAELNLSSWDLEPGVRLQLFYEDNIRLSTDDKQSSFGGLAELYANFSRRTEITDVSLRAAVVSVSYLDASELDRTDGAVEAALEYRMDRSQVGLLAELLYDSTLTSEEETTGLVQINKRRTFIGVSPYVTHDLTERARIGAELTLQDVSYEDVDEIILTNYQFAQAGLSAEHDLTERTALIGRVGYDRFDPADSDDQSEAYGLEAGFRHRLSQRTTLTALGGVRTATSSRSDAGDGSDDRSSGPVFELGVERDYELGSVNLLVQRSLLPSGRGTLLDTTRGTLQVSRPVTERLAARLRATAVRNRNPGGEVNLNDRDFLFFAPSLRWRLGQSTWLDLNYRFRFQDRETVSADASSNAIYIGFEHDWLAR